MTCRMSIKVGVNRVKKIAMEKKNLINVTNEGHSYELFHHESDGVETINFIQKEPIEDSTEMRTVQQGTTNEAVLQMLINRMQVLNEKFPDANNNICISHLEQALSALYDRTAERERRGVEGKHIA